MALVLTINVRAVGWADIKGATPASTVSWYCDGIRISTTGTFGYSAAGADPGEAFTPMNTLFSTGTHTIYAIDSTTGVQSNSLVVSSSDGITYTLGASPPPSTVQVTIHVQDATTGAGISGATVSVV